ncbi:MAG: methyltransferase domain-containing protein [Candidatus Heimdallarchaeota archaeon]|nr:methyltransferase domain-containing protein [Candidatus Heimdallarchaeota archaeon]
MDNNFSLIEYYRRRAPEYESIYNKFDSEIQKENQETAEILKQFFSRRSVIEVACGTGYWTQFLSATAKKITATDINKEVLDIAKQKTYHCPVSFQVMDAYKLAFEDNSFNAGLANFWFSHIPKKKINHFLSEFHRVLQPGSRVFLTDNHHFHLSDSLGKLITKKGDNNTYKLRQLNDGSEYLVLKNYYTVKELVKIFSNHIKGFSELNIHFSQYFWRVTYETD